MGIVTISRGTFSGGKAVAEQVAQTLGCPLVGREEVLQEASAEYGISAQQLTAALDAPPPFWQQVLTRRLAYVKCVAAVLLQHASSGELVYHGQVGHLLLANVPQVLRVRVIADLEQRVAAIMRELSLGRDEALAHIHRVDRSRARWARALYGVDWEDPELYDLVLNLQAISPRGAARIIVEALRTPEFQPTPASRQALDDARLGCRVWAAMARDPQTRSAGLEVTAQRGEVVITGSVGSAAAVDAIPRVARSVEGVRQLRCEVGVGSDWHW